MLQDRCFSAWASSRARKARHVQTGCTIVDIERICIYRASWHSQWPAVACSARCLEQIGMLQAYGHGPDWGYSVHRACYRACRWRLRQPTRTDASSSGLALRFAPLQPPALSEVQLPRCLCFWHAVCYLDSRACIARASGLTSGSPIILVHSDNMCLQVELTLSSMWPLGTA